MNEIALKNSLDLNSLMLFVVIIDFFLNSFKYPLEFCN